MLLSDFEKRWYRSLSIDRLQRITTLHNLGITHRDIREDHFHLPEDFFDTVLYDFSHCYTFSFSWPFPSRPVCLRDMKDREQNKVNNVVLDLAQRNGLRNYLAQSLELSPAEVGDLCTQNLMEESSNLELIVVKVAQHPNGKYAG
ncbi:hypothetical protein P170DRAFT_480886 [Aspergillus terreus]|uniref:Uncharacterized protein n=1 Tax=Aspergillus terreus TaxID=33178 RepID=A0A5M3ZE05_ASPTE|nr:hypothetical protein ATETN484_0012047700 [Aspergillus terreus]GFF19715.1 hypothetical protein P170DRAFT_480886 [Aspergillus terreus]